jgi:hypothetical protein
MRLFQHIILDFENTPTSRSNQYWASSQVFQNNNPALQNVNIYKKYSTYMSTYTDLLLNTKNTSSFKSATAGADKLISLAPQTTSRSLPT